MRLTRRVALQSMGLGLLTINLPLWAQQGLMSDFPFSEKLKLVGPDENGLFLPEGFTSRVIAQTGKKVSGTDYKWHYAPDGGAVVPTEDGGWIYVSNSESVWSFGNTKGGGVGAIKFDSEGNIIDAFRLLKGTVANCAGGLTPWGTWLSCEEFDFIGKKVPEFISEDLINKAGRVWETYPLEPEREAVSRPLMGAFTHEAAAFDLEGRVYLTEDATDGCFYRFVPETAGDLSQGVLQVAVVQDENKVEWRRVPDPEGKNSVPTRKQVEGATIFRGGEGAAYHEGRIYFTTKHDNRVWYYDISENYVEVLYDAKSTENPVLTGVDNLAISPAGQVIVAEDGGNMELVAVNSRGMALPILRLIEQDKSELTGPAFSPDGTRLYFSSQRGHSGRVTGSGGLTYEIQGPFHSLIV